jgi:uncharacterized membrane protein (DUF485 family)
VADDEEEYPPPALQRLGARADNRMTRASAHAKRHDERWQQLATAAHRQLHTSEEVAELADKKAQEQESELDAVKAKIESQRHASASTTSSGFDREVRLSPLVGWPVMVLALGGEVYYQSLALDALGVSGLGRYVLAITFSIGLIAVAHLGARLLHYRERVMKENVLLGVCLLAPLALIVVLAVWRAQFLAANVPGSSSSFLSNLIISLALWAFAFVVAYFMSDPAAVEQRRAERRVKHADKKKARTHRQLDHAQGVFEQVSVLREANHERAQHLCRDWKTLHNHAGASYRGRYARHCRRGGNPVPPIIRKPDLPVSVPDWVAQPLEWGFIPDCHRP